MTNDECKLGGFVTHACNDQRMGMITCISHRSNGVQIGVTWDNLEEKFHTADELCWPKLTDIPIRIPHQQ